MSIRFVCPNCRKILTGPDSAAGRRGKCPHCGHVVLLPASAEGVAAGPSGSASDLRSSGPNSGAVPQLPGAPQPTRPSPVQADEQIPVLELAPVPLSPTVHPAREHKTLEQLESEEQGNLAALFWAGLALCVILTGFWIGLSMDIRQSEPAAVPLLIILLGTPLVFAVCQWLGRPGLASVGLRTALVTASGFFTTAIVVSVGYPRDTGTLFGIAFVITGAATAIAIGATAIARRLLDSRDSSYLEAWSEVCLACDKHFRRCALGSAVPVMLLALLLFMAAKGEYPSRMYDTNVVASAMALLVGVVVAMVVIIVSAVRARARQIAAYRPGVDRVLGARFRTGGGHLQNRQSVVPQDGGAIMKIKSATLVALVGVLLGFVVEGILLVSWLTDNPGIRGLLFTGGVPWHTILFALQQAALLFFFIMLFLKQSEGEP